MPQTSSTNMLDQLLYNTQITPWNPTRIGTIEDDNGIYTGEIMPSLMEHGHGVKKYINGDVHEGMWVYGSPWGQGILIRSNGDKIEGLFYGTDIIDATVNYANGDVYTGRLCLVQPHGNGVRKLHNGGEIKAYFQNGHVVGTAEFLNHRHEQ